MKKTILNLVLAVNAAVTCAPHGHAAPPGPDGLARIQLRGIDHALARPGADLGRYLRIRLEQPIDISFDKNWRPTRTGSTLDLRPQDRDRIRNGLAEVLGEAFRQALTQTGKQGQPGYALTDEEGPDVLSVRVAVVDLSVTAPDTNAPGRARVYTVSTGEATLRAELVDSLSGTVLARFIDHREARNPGGSLELADSLRNRAEAERVASAWARILRNYLDTARAAR